MFLFRSRKEPNRPQQTPTDPESHQLLYLDPRFVSQGPFRYDDATMSFGDYPAPPPVFNATSAVIPFNAEGAHQQRPVLPPPPLVVGDRDAQMVGSSPRIPAHLEPPQQPVAQSAAPQQQAQSAAPAAPQQPQEEKETVVTSFGSPQVFNASGTGVWGAAEAEAAMYEAGGHPRCDVHG